MKPVNSILRMLTFAIAIVMLSATVPNQQSLAASATIEPLNLTDGDLARSLGEFRSELAEVNGTRIHYVVGGKGSPLILLPGWLQTWWEYNKVMPELAEHFTVIAADIRGMGGSGKPEAGYDKKTMAADILALAKKLGYERVNIAGHDIGAMVAYAFAANYPDATLKLALLDTPHPTEGWRQLAMIPADGTFGAKVDKEHPVYPWWFALNQVPLLPEELLLGRYHLIQNWSFNYMVRDNASISTRDRQIYYAAYKTADAIRGGNGWYRSFGQDIKDEAAYGKLRVPVLALGGIGYDWLAAALPEKVPDLKLVRVEKSGHFIPEEQPKVMTREFIAFFK